MQRFVAGVFLSATVFLGGLSFASAQIIEFSHSAQAIEFSHNVYHVRACPGPAPFGIARCHAHIVTDSRGHFLGRGATKNITPSGYNPSQLRAAYKLTATGSSSTLIAIVDAYGYTNASANLAVYRSEYGLPACTTANGCLTIYNESGQKSRYPAQNLGWDQEQALDLAMASVACPNCKIALVEANSSSYADLATAENVAAALGAHAISNSYGGPEQGTQGYESAYNHPGIAVTVSAGDSGYGAQFPATSPHVTAVGGTSLYVSNNTRGWTETAWSDGGSGCSAVYGKPTWQHDPLCTMRMEADVSAIADPSTGVAVYAPVSSNSAQWLIFGGTSVGAPLIAGIYAANGSTVSYGSNPYGDTAALNDITSGSNGSCGGTYFCTAGAGYDGPTGLGTPIGNSAF
ncbi:MAG: peptidase S8 [Rhizomicrobium sp.]